MLRFIEVIDYVLWPALIGLYGGMWLGSVEAGMLLLTVALFYKEEH